MYNYNVTFEPVKAILIDDMKMILHVTFIINIQTYSDHTTLTCTQIENLGWRSNYGPIIMITLRHNTLTLVNHLHPLLELKKTEEAFKSMRNVMWSFSGTNKQFS